MFVREHNLPAHSTYYKSQISASSLLLKAPLSTERLGRSSFSCMSFLANLADHRSLKNIFFPPGKKKAVSFRNWRQLVSANFEFKNEFFFKNFFFLLHLYSWNPLQRVLFDSRDPRRLPRSKQPSKLHHVFSSAVN